MSKVYLNWLGEPLQPKRIKFLDSLEEIIRTDDGYYDETPCQECVICADKNCNGGFDKVMCGQYEMEHNLCVITV